MNHEPDSEAVTAAIADVEPLDELTKARLIKTAMQATATPRRGRWLGVAAAVVAVVLVAGGAVAVLTRDDGERQVADSAVAPADATGGDAATDDQYAFATRDLGSADSEAELRDELDRWTPLPALTDSAESGKLRSAAEPQALASACPGPEVLPQETPVSAWATLVYKGKPALLAITTEDDVTYAFVLSPNGCTLVARVEL